jgi:peptidoglycan/xylan/chitin deacetylase (PgdA/CDA1 family)
MMTSDQVRALQRAGHTIGAHTVNHPILQSLSRADAVKEICEGRFALESIIGGHVQLFAYPNGKPGADYGSETVQVVRELGFDAAVSTAWRAARPGDDIMELPRFTPWDRSRARFGLRMVQTLLTS